MTTVIEREAEAAQDGELMRLDPAQVIPWPGLNPRTRFDAEKHRELVDSVRRSGGNFQPAVVARAQEGDVPYWLVIGERRLRACREAGVPLLAIVRPLTYREALELALLENLDREDLTPLDEARGYQKLIAAGIKQRDLAERVGRSQPHIANRVRLLELPEEILALIEDGILEVSYARDLLLPFVRIPEKVRAQFYREVAKRIREDARKLNGEVDQRHIREVVRSEAVKRSRPVVAAEVLWVGMAREEAPLFDPKLHQKCTCQGPRFPYSGSYGNRSNHARCFDETWWKAAQDEAKKRQEQKEEKARAKLAAAAERVGGLPVVDDAAFRRRYGHGTFASVARGGRVEDIDPSRLPAESLMIVRHEHGWPEIVCTDPDAAKKAKAAFKREVDRRVAAEREALTAADQIAASRLRESKRTAITGIEPWMIARILSVRPQRDDMLVVLRDLGHDVKIRGLEDYLESMPATALLEFFQVLAIRSRAGRLSTYQDPVRQRIEREVRTEHAAALADVMPKPDAPPDVLRGLEDRAARLRAALDALPDEAERTREQAEAVRHAAYGVEDYLKRHEGAIWPTPEIRRALDEAEAVDRWASMEWRDWWETDPAREEADAEDSEPECVECGCRESDACEGGCAWVIVFRAAGVGVCSSCANDEKDALLRLRDWAQLEGVDLEVLSAV